MAEEVKMRTHLSIKVKTLRYECKVLDKTAKHWAKAKLVRPTDSFHPMYHSIMDHLLPLKRELAAAIIAYRFLQRRIPEMVFNKYWPTPVDWIAVEWHVQRFGNGYENGNPIDMRNTMQRFSEWAAASATYVSAAACKERRQEKDRRCRDRRENFRLRRGYGTPEERARREAFKDLAINSGLFIEQIGPRLTKTEKKRRRDAYRNVEKEARRSRNV